MQKWLLALLITLPLTGFAQSDSYEPGSFWQVTAVDTMPTKFDDYIDDISGLWRTQMEMMKKDGKVLSYKMLANVHPRDGEPDLYLLVEWTSAAEMLDTPWEYWDAMTEKVVGSMEESKKKAVVRGEIRRVMSRMLARELTFTD